MEANLTAIASWCASRPNPDERSPFAPNRARCQPRFRGLPLRGSGSGRAALKEERFEKLARGDLRKRDLRTPRYWCWWWCGNGQARAQRRKRRRGVTRATCVGAIPKA